jgi:hypothetical protein
MDHLQECGAMAHRYLHGNNKPDMALFLDESLELVDHIRSLTPHCSPFTSTHVDQSEVSIGDRFALSEFDTACAAGIPYGTHISSRDSENIEDANADNPLSEVVRFPIPDAEESVRRNFLSTLIDPARTEEGEFNDIPYFTWQTLSHGEWINEGIISAYIRLLRARIASTNPGIRIFDPHFFQNNFEQRVDSDGN